MWPVARNAWSGAPILHARAARKGHRRRKRKRTRRNPLVRLNPRGVVRTLKGQVLSVFNKSMMVDAAQMTLGSVGTPVLAQVINKTFAKATGRTLPGGAVAGYGLQAVSAAVLATGAAALSRSPKLSKNILLGAVGGIFAGIAKAKIVPMLMGGGLSGLAGPRQDLSRELRLGAYATGAEVARAAVEEF